MKIKTAFDNPPIPDRSFDWSAVTEDYDIGHPIGHGPTEADAIADLKSQLSDNNPPERLADPPRSPCTSCGISAILSDIGFCCSCQHELTIFKAFRENHPVYILTETLGYYRVLACEKEHNHYLIKTSEFTFLLCAQLEDFHLTIPSLVTTGITKANDAILRFNQLHKQHLALS